MSDEQFSSVIAPLLGSLVTLASKILKSHDLASDAVQEAALGLWLEEQWPPNPRAWLIRAVIYRSLHMARSRARRRKHEALAGAERQESCDRDDPSRLLESQDLHRELLEALKELSPEHRDIFVLKFVEEWDYEAIAGKLQIPLGTVRSRLNRSRNSFRITVLQFLPDGCESRVNKERAMR
ncbi:RNA polymerase sigma factor [Singulisphaera sp. GP187]|uniref:RNA polymerase sigma factor n=1 Tax=Singulisphaera sp. GP187 TaxID=1882752 RepID=UPI0020B109B9|nr:RNA polymerase sigma factor [Singulisphaera sp. GP187]